MNKLGSALIVLVGIVLCLLIGIRAAPTQAQGRKAISPIWEYKMIDTTNPYDAQNVAAFNNLGKEGWEMCAVTSDRGGTYFYFKRFKP